jgi:hypothetical protein
MDDPQPAKRKPGRPRLPEAAQSATVTTWVRPADRDKILTLAKGQNLTVSHFVRDVIRERMQLKIKS